MGYRSPAAVTAVAQRLLPPEARILDAGAGTGLLGVALAEAGFTRLDGLDISPRMLAEAARKEIYADLREGRSATSSTTRAAYDGVVSAGVLTTGTRRRTSLDELVRITRPGRARDLHPPLGPGGRPGFDEKIAELERTAAGSSSSAATSSRRCRSASPRCSSASGPSA